MRWWISLTGLSIEEVMQFFKGGSSHWVNKNRLGEGPFAWGRGYGVFSVSPFRHRSSGEVYRRTGGASSQEDLFG